MKTTRAIFGILCTNRTLQKGDFALNNNCSALAALIAALVLLLAGRVTAQMFTVLHSFAGGSDGANPQADLLLSGNTLYGTAYGGGSWAEGTVFAINVDGTGFTNLHSFTTLYQLTNSDGANPYAGLISSGGTLYGTAYGGGNSGNGTVFAINIDGTSLTNLYSFTRLSFPSLTNSDGELPQARLALAGSTLYGTGTGGGRSGNGTVFAVNIDGTDFTNLYSFTALSPYPGTNSDGVGPSSGLILSGQTLFGTALTGGNSGKGTVFAVNIDGTGFTNLHSFTQPSPYPDKTNSDGAYPYASLILSSHTLFGTTQQGGSSGNGTVFALNTDGTGFTNLHSFTAGSGSYPNITNDDGAFPVAALILSGNTLYGTAGLGGSLGKGTVFALNTDGTGFRLLYSFGSGSDGAYPKAGLILTNNTLYGTTSGRDFATDKSGYGTVFSLSFRPQLTITPSETDVILSWPTNYAGFDYTGYLLQSTTNLIPPAVWTTNSIPPVVVNGQNTITNPITETQQFFRLSQ